MNKPATIAELQRFCADRGMPLEKMRFFIGENYTEPRAFGIYREDDMFIVYKNKADGSRVVRYHGPDEAYAVNELYQKLLEECHNRGIYPEGEQARAAAERKRKWRRVLLIGFVVVWLAFTAGSWIVDRIQHRKDGYYQTADRGMYYRYADDWYYYADDDWREADGFPYDDYDYYGTGYDSAWDAGDFKKSSAYDDIRESQSSSSGSDYSSWDSNDTDWDSDW